MTRCKRSNEERRYAESLLQDLWVGTSVTLRGSNLVTLHTRYSTEHTAFFSLSFYYG